MKIFLVIVIFSNVAGVFSKILDILLFCPELSVVVLSVGARVAVGSTIVFSVCVVVVSGSCEL